MDCFSLRSQIAKPTPIKNPPRPCEQVKESDWKKQQRGIEPTPVAGGQVAIEGSPVRAVQGVERMIVAVDENPPHISEECYQFPLAKRWVTRKHNNTNIKPTAPQVDERADSSLF